MARGTRALACLDDLPLCYNHLPNAHRWSIGIFGSPAKRIPAPRLPCTSYGLNVTSLVPYRIEPHLWSSELGSRLPSVGWHIAPRLANMDSPSINITQIEEGSRCFL
jgi:hypothetical protein